MGTVRPCESQGEVHDALRRADIRLDEVSYAIEGILLAVAEGCVTEDHLLWAAELRERAKAIAAEITAVIHAAMTAEAAPEHREAA